MGTARARVTDVAFRRNPTPDGAAAHAPAWEGIRDCLRRRGWLAADEPVTRVEPAGPGNMNLVLRVTTPERSLVVKQGRPFVEKYPHIPAPPERTLVEAEWYRLAGPRPELAARLPRLVGVDEELPLLVLSDLGPASDLVGVYAGERLADDDLEALVNWLATLHDAFRHDERARGLTNPAMRRLNHEHLFEVPLRPGNGLDLDAVTPGLAGVAGRLGADPRLVAATLALGELYLGEGTTLLHGDYHPGSWLAGPEGPSVIDPEFGFYGRPEIDVGALLAHLELSAHPDAVVEVALDHYLERAALDVELAWGFAGVETIRRLLGVAQLPLATDLDGKVALLQLAANRVRAVG